jgi:hypothetical protein
MDWPGTKPSSLLPDFGKQILSLNTALLPPGGRNFGGIKFSIPLNLTESTGILPQSILHDFYCLTDSVSEFVTFTVQCQLERWHWMLNLKQRRHVYGLLKANSHIKERTAIILLRSVTFVKGRRQPEKAESAWQAMTARRRHTDCQQTVNSLKAIHT